MRKWNEHIKNGLRAWNPYGKGDDYDSEEVLCVTMDGN